MNPCMDEASLPAPTVAVALTAAELRALAGVHGQFADAAGLCRLHGQEQDGQARAALLLALADRLGPPADEADGLLGRGP